MNSILIELRTIYEFYFVMVTPMKGRDGFPLTREPSPEHYSLLASDIR